VPSASSAWPTRRTLDLHPRHRGVLDRRDDRHPKYYSYVGLVAPPDRKAVYMGYAFLYGVIGSLVGSNLGGVMYESMLKP